MNLLEAFQVRLKIIRGVSLNKYGIKITEALTDSFYSALAKDLFDISQSYQKLFDLDLPDCKRTLLVQQKKSSLDNFTVHCFDGISKLKMYTCGLNKIVKKINKNAQKYMCKETI